jgi:hypothetical protein
MKLTWKALSTSMIAAAGAVPVALALSATAAADPAPAPAPAVPNLPIVNELASVPALAPQLLQGVTSTLTGGAPAAAPAPAPAATASVTLPQMPGTARARSGGAGRDPGQPADSVGRHQHPAGAGHAHPAAAEGQHPG